MNKPDLHLFWNDETEYWLDSIVAKTGRIIAVYLVDLAQPVHICSLTPSYFCHFIENIVENELDDALYDEIMYADNESGYFSKPKGAVSINHFWEAEIDEIEDEADYDDFIDTVLEYYRGNSCWGEYAAFWELIS